MTGGARRALGHLEPEGVVGSALDLLELVAVRAQLGQRLARLRKVVDRVLDKAVRNREGRGRSVVTKLGIHLGKPAVELVQRLAELAPASLGELEGLAGAV